MVNTTKQFYFLAMTILVLLGLFAWQSPATRRFEPLKPTVMAFVDIQQLFSSLEERAKLLSDAEAFAMELQEDIISRRLKITDIDSEIELYKKGSEKRKELEQKQKLDSLEYNVYVDCCESYCGCAKPGTSLVVYHASCQESACQGDTRNGICTGHEWRMQSRWHLRDQLKAQKDRQHKNKGQKYHFHLNFPSGF